MSAISDPIYQLDQHAVLTKIDPLPGQSKDHAYACLTQGLSMPADGLAYIVEITAGQVGDFASPAPNGAAIDPIKVRVVGYIDKYARAFLADSILTMPPAKTPDLQLKRYASAATSNATTSTKRGCVEIAANVVERADVAVAALSVNASNQDDDQVGEVAPRLSNLPWRVAEFSIDANDAITFSDTRVNLGANARPLPFAQAIAVAYVAFCLAPRSQRVSLSMLSVADVMRCLSSQDLFEDIDHILKAIGKAAKHPLLNPPGILLYLAHLLRATGIEGKGPADIASDAPQALVMGDLTWVPSDGSAPVPLSLPFGHPDQKQLPDVYLVRTTDYADLFYIAYRRDLVSEQGNHMLVQVEGILNRFLLMVRKLQERGMLETATQAQCAQLDRWIVDDILVQVYDKAKELAEHAKVEPTKANVNENRLNTTTTATTTRSPDDSFDPDNPEWDTDLEIRIMVAQAYESLVLPYRLDYRLRLSASSDHLYVDAIAPDVTLMPRDIFDTETHNWRSLDKDDRQAAEARYAAHLATLLAITGFACSNRLQAVTTNIWRESRSSDAPGAAVAMDQTCELSACFDRDKLSELLCVHTDADNSDAQVTAQTAQTSRTAQAQDDTRPWFAREPFGLIGQMGHAYSMGEGYELAGTSVLTSLDTVKQAYEDTPEHTPAQPSLQDIPLEALQSITDMDDIDSLWDSSFEDLPYDDDDNALTTDEDAAGEEDMFALAGSDGLVTDENPDENSAKIDDKSAAPNGADDAGISTDKNADSSDGISSTRAQDDQDGDTSGSMSAPNIMSILNAVTGIGSIFGVGGNINPIEIDEHPFDEAGQRLLIARRVRDMGIYEDTPRRELAQEASTVFKQQGESAAIAQLRDIHDRTENQLVKAACLSVSDGIVSDRITTGSTDVIDRTFSDVYGLRSNLRNASKLLRSEPGKAVDLLNEIVKRVDNAGWFVDTDTRAYRYFDCYASRALYAGRCKDDLHGRELRMVADEYYLAHHRLAAILSNSVGQTEEAIAHALRCVELGPSAATSYMRLARCYFATFDYASEIETLRDMLRIAWNPADVGMALYWLGYAFWMTDEKRVGMACYQRCGSYDPNIVEPASAELNSFLSKEGGMPDYLDEAEADNLLKSTGIDLDLPVTNANFLVRAADAALRAKSQRLGFNLLGSAAAMLHDDALTPVIESIGA